MFVFVFVCADVTRNTECVCFVGSGIRGRRAAARHRGVVVHGALGLEGYLEGYQRTAPPRPEGKLIPIAYRIAPRGRLK